MKRPVTSILAPADIDRLRVALACFTVASVHDALGLAGQSAHARGDLLGAGRALREGPADARLRGLVELFLLGSDVDERAVAAALHPLPLDVAHGSGLIERSAGSVRAALDVRPYAEDGALPGSLGFGPALEPEPEQWWVVSDLGSDVRPGPLPADHVLGIGSASLTLAQAVPRTPVGRALDLGTGCGVQALHLGRHAEHVTATDVSDRALTLAATTAALSGQSWDLRLGSLFDPVIDERFDLVVANPPFVVSPGTGGYDYRDSGMAGDGVCETLLRGLPDLLSPNGTAVLLANWIIPREGDWQERVTGWLAGRGCDAWVWQREVAEPAEYVSLWLRDAGERPGSPRWAELYEAWMDWFDRAGVAAVGLGMAALRRSAAPEGHEIIVTEDVPQPVRQPVGGYLSRWFDRQRWLAGSSRATVLSARLRVADGVVRTRDDLCDSSGWSLARQVLRQTQELQWELEVDDAIASLVAACDGNTPLGVVLSVLAAVLDEPVDDVTAAALPVVHDLIVRGFLIPADLS